MTDQPPDAHTLAGMIQQAWNEAFTAPCNTPVDYQQARLAAETALAAIAVAKPHWTEKFGPVVLCEHGQSPPQGMAAIITERDQLRSALQRLADDGNLEARDLLAAIPSADDDNDKAAR